MNSKAKKETPKKLPFEKALARLEEIVDAMEKGDLPLDRMTAYFEEGNELIRQCGRQLDEVERKIEILVQKDGDVVAEPFSETSESSPNRAPSS